MKQPALFFLFVFALIAVFSSSGSAGEQDFVLVNGTGVDIHALYVSPTQSDDWGDDILGRDVLPDGDSATVRFPRDASSCVWDFSVEDSEENSIEWAGIDLCKHERITLHMEGERAWATFE